MDEFERRNASKHEDGVDLISNLPDPILILILSGLPSTEELIRTSILSRRWRYLWASAPSLNLEFRGEKSKFKEFVYWAFLNRSVDLDSFRLYCWDQYSMSTIERWIHATVMKNVKQLDLSFGRKDESEDTVMPHCLVTCASLEVLKFCFDGRLTFPSFSGFPGLRVLKLENVELFDDDFLESCPLLEDLTLDDCRLDKLNQLCISCPKLKKLTVCNNDKEDDDLCGCLKLSCPQLVFLHLTGQVASNFIFERLYSLKKAVIDPEGSTIHRLFPGISHVESLTSDLCSLYEGIDAASDPVLPNLKTLELITINANYLVKGLIQILRYCPKLDSLSLKIEQVYKYESENYNETEYPRLDEAATGRILTRDVKWVEVFEFNGEKPKLAIDWYGNKSEWAYVFATWGFEAR